MSPDNNCELKKEEMGDKVDSACNKSKALSFQPIIIPACIPYFLKEQASKYSSSPATSYPSSPTAAAAPPTVADTNNRARRKYCSDFLKSLRFVPDSTSPLPAMPFIPGIAPGVRSVSPVRVQRDTRPHVMYYDQMVPIPYMRYFRPTSWYEEPEYIYIYNY